MLINLRNAMLSGGKRTPTAADYIQDGLVALWDGIENAGWGQHDPNATVWKDLVGSYDISLNSNASWSNDHIIINGYSGAAAAACPSSVEGKTIEVVCQHNYYNSSAWQYLVSVYGANSRPRQFAAFRGNSSAASVGGGYYHRYFDSASSSRAASISSFSPDLAYEDGVPKITTQASAYGSNGGVVTLGASSPSDRASFQFRGNCFSIRVYNTNLTQSEILANYAVDKARFNLPDAT